MLTVITWNARLFHKKLNHSEMQTALFILQPIQKKGELENTAVSL